jgi:hypothetical protein
MRAPARARKRRRIGWEWSSLSRPFPVLNRTRFLRGSALGAQKRTASPATYGVRRAAQSLATIQLFHVDRRERYSNSPPLSPPP